MAANAVAEASSALVVVVGSNTALRSQAAQELIADGYAVVLCAGPSGCPLLREDRCVLVDVADVVVVLPTTSHDRKVTSGLAMCAQAARRAVVVGPATARDLSAQIHPRSAGPHSVAEAVRVTLQQGCPPAQVAGD